MLGGGLAHGEVFLFLAPTGGGKTTLSVEIAWRRATQRSHTVYLTYDQPIEGDIQNRFCSLVTGIPRCELERHGIAGMSPEIQRRFQAWREAYGRFLHLYDVSGARQGNGGIADIVNVVENEIEQGRRPALVIVDWLQCAVLKGTGPGGYSAAELAGRMDDYAGQFAAICEKHHIQGIIAQQLASQYQRATNVKLDHTMAEACSTLGNHCDHAVVLGRLTPDGYGMAISSKGVIPAAQRPPQLVRLNGGLNTIETADSVPYNHELKRLAASCMPTPKTRTRKHTPDHGDR